MSGVVTESVLAASSKMPTLEDFGHDPVWMVLLKTVGVFAVLVVITLLMIWWERRLIGWMQQRPGPNRNGPFGLLQSLADGIKLAFKEEIIPALADKPVYWLAPVVVAVPAFVAFSVIPMGPVVSIFGTHTPLQLTDSPVAVLIVLACSSMGVYGIFLAGWASGSTYPLLGGLRSSAQMISYEIAMGLSIVGVFLWSGSMSTSEIVAAQAYGAGGIFGDYTPSWFVFPLIVSAGIYLISMVGETNRAPFDLAEAESELVGGFHTEYSSMKFAMFFLAEYVNMITVSALAATMFFGGWRAPWPLSLWDGANTGWWPMLWWLGKTVFFLSMFVWLRAALPRLRYDQFMRFGWKVLVPVALVWILFIAFIRTAINTNGGKMPWWAWIVVAVAVVATLLFVFFPKRLPPVENINSNPPFPIPPMSLIVPGRTKSAARAGEVGGARSRAERRKQTAAALASGGSRENSKETDDA